MEKLIWEIRLGQEWFLIGDFNRDRDGELNNFTKEYIERCPYMFRQTPSSKIGIGDSTGNVKILLDVDNDEETIKKMFSKVE